MPFGSGPITVPEKPPSDGYTFTLDGKVYTYHAHTDTWTAADAPVVPPPVVDPPPVIPPPVIPPPTTDGNCITTRCGNLGTATYSADVRQKSFANSPNPKMYFCPSKDGKSGIVFNYWFLTYGPAGIDIKSYSDYRNNGGNIETCAGAGTDWGGKCLHRFAGVKERAVRLIYCKGVTHLQNPQFDATNFNVVILNDGYTDAMGHISAAVIQAAMNKALSTSSIWGGYEIPIVPPWPGR